MSEDAGCILWAFGMISLLYSGVVGIGCVVFRVHWVVPLCGLTLAIGLYLALAGQLAPLSGF